MAQQPLSPRVGHDFVMVDYATSVFSGKDKALVRHGSMINVNLGGTVRRNTAFRLMYPRLGFCEVEVPKASQSVGAFSIDGLPRPASLSMFSYDFNAEEALLAENAKRKEEAETRKSVFAEEAKVREARRAEKLKQEQEAEARAMEENKRMAKEREVQQKVFGPNYSVREQGDFAIDHYEPIQPVFRAHNPNSNALPPIQKEKLSRLVSLSGGAPTHKCQALLEAVDFDLDKAAALFIENNANIDQAIARSPPPKKAPPPMDVALSIKFPDGRVLNAKFMQEDTLWTVFQLVADSFSWGHTPFALEKTQPKVERLPESVFNQSLKEAGLAPRGELRAIRL